MGVIVYIDTVLVPFSLFVTVGYHVFLWRTFKHNPSHTSIGIDALKRKSWFRDLKQGDDKTGMLAVQSLRNAKMVTILTASISILVNLCLAALTNNAYKASNLLTSEVFGLQSPTIFVVKYGLASLFLTASFLCSSMAVGCFVDANFLINACVEAGDNGEGHGVDKTRSFREYTRLVLERGFLMAMIGNRLMCVSVPLLLWMFGPLPVVVSSLGLVWVMYHFDFAAVFGTCNRNKNGPSD